MRTMLFLAAALALGGCAAKGPATAGPTPGTAASGTENAAGLQRALARAITDRAGWDTLDLLVECRTDDEGLTSARVFGSGIGIWNDERQFRLDPDQIRSLLRALQSADFPGMEDTYGGAPRPARPRGGAMVTVAICRIELSLGAHDKRVVQLAQGAQSPMLKELADDLMEICQAPARLGLTAASLRDGLEKISRGELAPETLRIVAHRKPREKQDPPGFLLRVAGNRATTLAYEPARGYRDPVVLRMSAPELRALAREVAARDPATWPSNLYAVDYTDLSIRVLNHEKAIQARQFAGMAPSAHGRQQTAFEEVFAILQGLHRNALDQGHLMPEPPEAVQPGASALRAPIVLNDDGGWCWFQDERALIVAGRLVFGSVAAGRSDPSRRGMVEATSVDLATGTTTRSRLSATPVEKAGRYDDHDTPAFVARGDGRLVAVWAGHGYDNRILSRVSLRPGDATAWSEERAFVPSPSSSVTYSNLHRLAGERGRIYDFFRGLDNRFKPSVAWSDDEGETWKTGGVVIDVPAAFRHRPYVKYASDGQDTVHLAYTEGHPRNFDNGLYHAFYRKGTLYRSDGKAIRPLAEGLRDPVEGTRIFEGDPRNVAWVIDLELDAQGRPFVAYSVQKDSAGLPAGEGGADHRYRLARWTGSRWDDREIAFGGSRLYPGEDDYTGGIALVPGDPARLFISTDADPSTGAPLASTADGKRHWEIFRGATTDGGRTWRWQPLTRDSTADNLRPIVPRTAGRDELLLWLRGRYRSYTDYDLEVVGLLRPLAYVRSESYDTYMPKLTLSVDEAVIERAKRYAARRSTSVSALVERYLDLLSRPDSGERQALSPNLARLRAEWRGVSVDEDDYYKYLERKYR